MRSIMVGLLTIVALLSVGCSMMPPVQVTYPVFVSAENPYDLHVQVWDKFRSGPFENAQVVVVQNGSKGMTGLDGWVRLSSPYGSRDVKLLVSFYDYLGYGRTEERWVHLEHSFTERRVEIDSRPRL